MSFKTKNWESFDNMTKMRLLQEVENKQAKKQNRTPIRIIFKELDKRNLGAYSPSEEKIILNKNILDNNFFALETVIHEGHHRQQHMLAKNDSKVFTYLNDRYDIREKTKEEWTENMKNYSNSLSYETYYLQPVEINAVESAYSDMLSIDELYEEQDYKQYLTDKRKYIDNVHREALKRYGSNYQEVVKKLRTVENINPQKAKILEREYKEKQERYLGERD